MPGVWWATTFIGFKQMEVGPAGRHFGQAVARRKPSHFPLQKIPTFWNHQPYWIWEDKKPRNTRKRSGESSHKDTKARRVGKGTLFLRACLYPILFVPLCLCVSLPLFGSYALNEQEGYFFGQEQGIFLPCIPCIPWFILRRISNIEQGISNDEVGGLGI